ncbi:recombinase family protein [Brevibacterium casei]|uniref:Site-specific DNA recombinase n=1 Tax=Brevibacterium casei CIP 102111 TaxID=1255625 RepID=A0A2H1K4N5_9MICO|nr:recombinase family protein [Brevibacterium casei]QPR38031.1 recombinase family protein [Brevibacterium casei]QPR45322.1 recombinase family protein [Brevibacterium casei]SMX94757.1 Site-specific DNA recombinase [Brevibacterium casei CIP 102111]
MNAEANDPTIKAAIYARISRDRAGAGLGVERQERDCRQLADRLGWTVAEVYVDNDISAYSGRTRPQYRQMLRDVEAGKITGIIAWHTDRLHRRTVELEEFVAVAEEHGTKVQTVTSGTVDLSTASGRMVARMLGAAAQHEIDHARERMKAKKAQMAREGKYRGGQRPYGFEKDGATVRDDEAEVIRRATKGIIAGRSLRGIADELNAEELTTSTGRSWTYARLRDVLVRPRNAGKLSTGDPGHGEPGILGDAEWPAIVSEEEWTAAYKILTDPSRRIQQGNATRWLGSGIYICGKCGTAMRPAPTRGKYLYRCTAQAHLTVMTEQTDSYVRAVVADLVRDPRIVAALDDDGEEANADRARRAELATRLETFEADYMDGTISGKILRASTDKVQAQIDEIDQRLTASMQRSASSKVTSAEDPGAAFLDAPIDIQRAVLAAVARVEIRPADRAGVRWSEDRVRITPADN